MTKAALVKLRKDGRVRLDLRALQRAIEDRSLSAGDREDVLSFFPELRRVIDEWEERLSGQGWPIRG